MRIEVDITDIEKFLKKYNAENPGEGITLTSIFLKYLGQAGQNSDYHGKIIFGNFIPIDSVDIGVAVSIDDKNLFQFVARDCGRKGIKDISSEIRKGVKKLKTKKSKEYKSQMKKIKSFPFFSLKPIFLMNRFISYQLELPIKVFQIKVNQYGFQILSNISTFGITNFSAPMVPMTNSLFVMLMNAPVEKPIVVNGEIKVRRVMNLDITFDCRFVDVPRAKEYIDKGLDVLKNPQKYL